MDRRCMNCKWYESFCGVCCNGDSEHRADFRLEDETCEEWKETMAEYIEREAAIKAVNDYAHMAIDKKQMLLDTVDDTLNIVARIEKIPAADVVPVVHGKWIRPHWKSSDYCCDCSECDGEAMHREYQWNKKGIYPICPNCGAKMDGGEDNG